MYIEDNYLNDEMDFITKPTDNVEITNVNNNW